MITPELIAYIKSERMKGVDDKTIKTSIVTQGWNGGDFEEAVLSMAGISKKLSESVTPELRKYRKDKRLFFFILYMIAPIIYCLSFLNNVGGISGSGIILVSTLIATYVSAHIVTSMMRPQNTKIMEVFSVVGHCILGVALGAVLSFFMYFVTCLFASATGLMRF